MAPRKAAARSELYEPIIGGFVPLAAAWNEEQGRKALFPSEASARWFLRAQRARLIQAKALLMHAGRMYFHPERVAQVQLEAGLAAVRAAA